MEGNYPSILSEWMENGTARRYVLDHELSVTELLTMVSITIRCYGFQFFETYYSTVSGDFTRRKISARQPHHTFWYQSCSSSNVSFSIDTETKNQENILINQSKMPLICDFGVSRMLNSSLTSRGTTGLGRGTTRWMAPELLSYIPSPGSDSVSHTRETDIWALGMTFYVRCMTTISPYLRCWHRTNRNL